MSEFHEFLTDKSFVGSYNVFISGNLEDRNNGIIFVEDATDSVFWEEFIGHHYQRKYICRPSTKGGKTITGKRFLETIYDQANDQVLIAVDSDFDYIVSKIEANHPFNRNKYIIHTYGFSRESVQLEKNDLQDFFRKTRLFIPNNINILLFLNKLSRLSFKALAKYILLLKSINYATTHQKDFNHCFKVMDKKIVNEDISLNISIIDNVERKLDVFFRNNPVSELEIECSEKFLNDIGINKDNAYRFISGHIVFDLLSKIHRETLKLLIKKEVKNVEETVNINEIRSRKIQVVKIFDTSFSFDTHCNRCNIDLDDEIHKLILSHIKNINS